VNASTSGSGPAKPQISRHPPPRRILVVVDPAAHAQPALDKAVRIAERCGSALELYVCDVDLGIPESWADSSRTQEYRDLRRQRQLAELAALAAPLTGRGLHVDSVCEWHAPLQQGIGHHVIHTRPDLVVKETHQQVAAGRADISYTDWNLIRQIPVPLLLVRRKPWPPAVRIAVALDPSRLAERPVALDEAIAGEARSLAGLLGGMVHAYHVLQVPPHLPDVLVMGTETRPRPAHGAVGGTAARVLEQVDCDLLVVKPPGFVSPLRVTD
jgi:universal stress protein E